MLLPVRHPHLIFSLCVTFLVFMPSARAQDTPRSGGDFSQDPLAKKLPTGIILVKGAWSSASDSVTPLPEGGAITNHVFVDPYFGLSYTLPPNWAQQYSGPPSSPSGYYVLAQIKPSDAFKGAARGTILIAAQDLFFTVSSASNALELIDDSRDHLSSIYQVERAPSEVNVAGHLFVRFDYGSPVADLHWHILATQIRCHMVQFVFTSRDRALAESLIQQMNTMKLPVTAGLSAGNGGGDVPVCMKDYARDENIIEKVDPFLTERRFNPIPVRIIIDKQGKIKHIHFLSAFPEQAKAITDALSQWRFKPYLQNGQPVEVETGIMFGTALRRAEPSGIGTVSE